MLLSTTEMTTEFQIYYKKTNLTPLHSAAERGNLEVCQVLIEKGADVNALDSQVLIYLNLFEDFAIIYKVFNLIKEKIISNQTNQTPLHKAVDFNRENVVKLLLHSGAAIKVLDVSRQSPEAIARSKKLYEILGIISSFRQKSDDSLPDFRSDQQTH